MSKADKPSEPDHQNTSRFHSYEDIVARCQQIQSLRTLTERNGAVNCIAFSPDGRLLASGWRDGRVQLWEVETGQVVRTLRGGSGEVESVAFSPNGYLLASGSEGGIARVWEVETSRVVRTLGKSGGGIKSVAFSPDGRLLASGLSEGKVWLWEVEIGQLSRTLQGGYERVKGVAFSPDGRLLASGLSEGKVWLWEVETDQVSRTLQGGYEGIESVAFSPDGHLLASGSRDGTICLWEVETGRNLYILSVLPNPEEHTIPRRGGNIYGLAWSPNSEILVSHTAYNRTALWHVPTGQRIEIPPAIQAASNMDKCPYCNAELRPGDDFCLYCANRLPLSWGIGTVAISPNGRLLAAYGPWAIQLWDISALDVGPGPGTVQKKAVSGVSMSTLQLPLRDHLRTLPFCHVTALDLSSGRAANWLQGAAAAGWPLPLALAYDLGFLLSQPMGGRTLAKPDYLPFDEDTSTYLAFLQRLADHPLVRDLPFWQPPLADAVLGVLLARLVEGLELPATYGVPAGPQGVSFAQILGSLLATARPAEIWQQTPPDERPAWRTLLSAANLARLESNFLKLDREELRFLALYGAPLAGTPDPRDLLDLLALTSLPDVARLAMSQTLTLLPHISSLHTSGGLQTYPEGGYEGLARQGSLDSLLPIEIAYPAGLFLHRVLNHEALYYGREREKEQRRELVYLVGQVGWGLGGDGQVLMRALLLSLGQIMQQRGYEVLYSFAGATLSEPRPLDKPGEIGRVLYYQERAAVNSGEILQGVLHHLRAWRETYQRRLVFWVVSEYFDADEADAHASAYQALQAESEQEAWYIHVGPVQEEQRHSPPVTARSFAHWQVIESARLWAGRERERG